MGENFRNSILAPSPHWPSSIFISEYCSELSSASDKAKKSVVGDCGCLHNWGQSLKTFKMSVQTRNFQKISRYLLFGPIDAPIPAEKSEYSLTIENLAFLWCPSLLVYHFRVIFSKTMLGDRIRNVWVETNNSVNRSFQILWYFRRYYWKS